MPTTYREASPEVAAIVKKLRPSYPDLAEADVTIKLLFARGADGPAIIHHGWPAQALIRVNNLRDRVAGLDDLTLLIDEEGWEEWTDKERTAKVDHELMHVEVQRNKAGAVRFDDANRPKVRLRPHDFQFGGFHQIAQRHGIHAPEAQAVASVVRVWKQRHFAWAEQPELSETRA